MIDGYAEDEKRPEPFFETSSSWETGDSSICISESGSNLARFRMGEESKSVRLAPASPSLLSREPSTPSPKKNSNSIQKRETYPRLPFSAVFPDIILFKEVISSSYLRLIFK